MTLLERFLVDKVAIVVLVHGFGLHSTEARSVKFLAVAVGLMGKVLLLLEWLVIGLVELVRWRLLLVVLIDIRLRRV